MTQLHTCQVDDVCGNTTILRGYTLEELHGRIGPQYPILLDGRRGVLTASADARHRDGEVRFVPAVLN